MRNSSRFVLAAVAAIAALSFAGPAGACGTISNVGATIAPGNGSPDSTETTVPEIFPVVFASSVGAPLASSAIPSAQNSFRNLLKLPPAVSAVGCIVAACS